MKLEYDIRLTGTPETIAARDRAIFDFCKKLIERAGYEIRPSSVEPVVVSAKKKRSKRKSK